MTTTKPVKVQGTVMTNEAVSPDTVQLTIDGSFPSFKAGQFCFLTLMHDGKRYKRAYSIISTSGEPLQLCIKAYREASTAFTRMEPGTNVEVFMPFGHFTLPEQHQPLIMIATGTGVAPYKSMIKQALAQGALQQPITLLVGNKTAADQLYHEEWRALAQEQEHFKYYPTLTREEQPGILTGRVQAHLPGLLDPEAAYFICGVTAMVEEVEQLLLKEGIKKEQIHYEKYG